MSDGVYRPFQHPAHLRALGLGAALIVVLLALVSEANGLALTVIFATFGFYSARFATSIFPDRVWLKRLGYFTGIVCVALVPLGIMGWLPDLVLRGYGVWRPLFALLLAFMVSVLLEREKVAEADKFQAILALHPHPDGGEWNAKEMEEATDGEVDVEFFERLRNRKTAFGSPAKFVAMARIMDFPSELWDRSPEWWESVVKEREKGVDVGNRLREWDCYTPEQVAEELGISTREVHRMLEFEELESRTGSKGELQVRANSVGERALLNEGVPPDQLPPWNREALPGETGNGNYPNRNKRVGQFKDR